MSQLQRAPEPAIFPPAQDAGAGRRYAFAVVCVVVGWLCREAFTPAVGPTALPFVTFFPAVAVAAWYGGLGAGLASILLSGVTAWWFFLSPVREFPPASWENIARLTVFAVSSLFIVVAFASMHGVQQRLVVESERRRRAELHLTATLSSIGDGVIAVDTQGRVTFSNAVAQRLMERTAGEVLGRPLAEVFPILNEETRQPVENPVDKVLATGTVVGLANHTILMTKNGREVPIDDSAAPIRDADGMLCGVILVFRDVSEHRAVVRAKAHLAAIVEYSGDAIVTKSLDGIIQTWNAGAERLFGYTAEEAVGKPVTILFPPDRLTEEEGILRHLKEGLPFERFETVRVAKDGRRIPVWLSISPMRDDEGRVIGASKIIHDVSEIVAAREAAQHASRMKDEFLATLSHELRTPLNAVLGYATLMRMGSLTQEETDEAAEIIERNARVQAQLIEDLLDMNRIVSGKVAVQTQVVPAADVVNAAVDTVRPTAEAKGVRLVPEVEATAAVHADPGRLQQVVWNLLSNAVKFTPPQGEVRVVVRATNSQVEIVVRDTGQGIEQEFLPFVFDRFRQADPSNTRHHGGLGLGLAIVRNLVELQGGTVRAHSRGKNLGAEFTVTLPRAGRLAPLPFAAARNAGSGPRSPTPVDLSGLRLLVVDDERDAAALIDSTLRKCGAEVVTASSAREAFDRWSENRFDVVVSDVSMPGEDGYSLIRRVRESEQGRRRTPAVAMTALAGDIDRERALAAGFDLHVAKPIEPATLPQVIARLVRGV